TQSLYASFSATYPMLMSLKPSVWLSCLFCSTTRPTPRLSPLPLHDALPICADGGRAEGDAAARHARLIGRRAGDERGDAAREERSEEHTSELQSLTNLVCRLLLDKKTRRLLAPPKACCASREIRYRSAMTSA